MPRYLIYDKATGHVARHVECPEDTAEMQAQPGECLIQVEDFPVGDAWIDNGEVRPAQQMSLSVSCSEFIADGKSGPTISGLPDGCTVSINGVDVKPAGSEWTFSTTQAGTYTIRVYAPRYEMSEVSVSSYDASLGSLLDCERRKACDAIDAAAGEARARFLTVAPGQESTYTAKYAQAQAYVSAGCPDDASAYQWIAAESAATGKTPKETSEIIVAAGDKWANEIGPKIEGLRIASKDRITAATTVDAALDAMREGLATLQAIQ